jgi:glutathione S-transferase
MYTLYYSPGACSLASHIVLEWIGRPYKVERVKPSDPDYRMINPAGAVPALDMGDGVILTQSGAILRFLARSAPECGLDSDSTIDRSADLERWSEFLTGDLHPAFYPVFSPARYTTDTDKTALDKVRAAGLLLVKKHLTLLERHLSERTYVTANKRTIVDAYLFPMTRWAVSVLPDGLSDFPHIKHHQERMLGDAAVQRVMEVEGLAKA